MDESRALLAALAERAAGGEERRKIEVAWSDFETALARGEETSFVEIAVRRKIVTRAEADAFIAAETDRAGSGTAPLHRPAPLPGSRLVSSRSVFVLFLLLGALGGAVIWKLGRTPSPKAPFSPRPPVEDEAERREAFEHALAVAYTEAVGGDAAGSERSLSVATDLARSNDDLARVEQTRGRIATALATAPEPPPAPPRSPVSTPTPRPLPERLAPTPAETAHETPPAPSGPESASPGAEPPNPSGGPGAEPPNPEAARALAFVSEQLLELARFCTRNKAYREARAELETVLALVPDSPPARKELEALADLASDPTRYFRENGDRERSNAHARAAFKLAELAQGYESSGDRERYDRWVEAIQDHFPGETAEKALKRLGLVYFEPYLEWMKPADWQRLDQGLETVEGEWKDPDEVARLDRQHSSRSDPWVLTDGTHELRTTVTLRLGKKLLAQVTAYRRFFLKQFGRAWDLRAPQGKLPIFLARNREEYQAEIDAVGKRLGEAIAPPENTAAFYHLSERPLNPCFVTLEAQTLDGSLLKFGWDNVLLVLKHELTHQVAFEYSRASGKPGKLPRLNYWVVESLANFMCFYANDRGHWHLSRPRTIPTRNEGTYEVSPFAWCLEHEDRLPRLERYFETPPDRFMTEECYSVATCAAYFLLFGEHRKYRAGYIRLCELVHEHRATEKSFDECFPGVDRAALERQFHRFVSGIALDE